MTVTGLAWIRSRIGSSSRNCTRGAKPRGNCGRTARRTELWLRPPRGGLRGLRGKSAKGLANPPQAYSRERLPMLNLSLSKSPGSTLRVLCLGAHCDDIEIGCGGTILSLLERHETVIVHWVVFSSTEERGREAQASADAFLGAALEKEIAIKEYRDG